MRNSSRADKVALRALPVAALIGLACLGCTRGGALVEAAEAAGRPSPWLEAPTGAPSLTARETLRRTQEMTLYPERLDRRFLVGALDALEVRFDSVRFEDRGTEGTLQVGDARLELELAAQFDVETYLATLAQGIEFAEGHLQEEREPDDDLELIALRGGLFAIDKYATIFSGRSTEDFRIRFSGHLKGIGSTIGRENGQLVALRVFPASPAAHGGLESGDIILAIDGEPTQPLTVSGAVDRIRGEADTVVVLNVQRGEQLLDVSITRGDVIVPSVEARLLEDGIAYTWIDQVSRTTGAEFAAKLTGLRDLRGLVLDLRGNSGGAMSGAHQLADFFLDDRELIVRVVGRGGIEPPGPGSRLLAEPGVEFRIPVVVLVDPSTASAAEILSGALAPLPSVTLLGQKTFGKGVIQQVLALPEENLLKLTVAQYLLSSDRVVDEVGIAPDISLLPVPEDQLGALAALPEGSIPYLRRARKPSDESEREPAEADPFPVEAARILLERGPEAGREEIRRRSARQIGQRLASHGVRWSAPLDSLPVQLPEPLQVVGRYEPLTAGRTGTVHLEVINPTRFALRDVWLALHSALPAFPAQDPPLRAGEIEPVPPPYLSNKLLALGEIPPGGRASGRIEITPPEGVAALDQLIGVKVAAGMRPLYSERLVLELAPQPPLVEIALRHEGTRLEIELRNRGAGASGTLLVEVEGASRWIEDLAAGATERIELPLSGEAKDLFVTFSGPWARRRLSLPIPEADLAVVPPRLSIARERGTDRGSVHVQVSDPAGLREGWLVLDDQKEAYVAWGGRSEGDLRASFDAHTDHRLAIKVESSSGVTLIEALDLWAPSPAPAQ